MILKITIFNIYSIRVISELHIIFLPETRSFIVNDIKFVDYD